MMQKIFEKQNGMILPQITYLHVKIGHQNSSKLLQQFYFFQRLGIITFRVENLTQILL